MFVCEKSEHCIECPITDSKADPCEHMLEVAPVRRGKWIGEEMYQDGHVFQECSSCHKVRVVDHHCSACGAIMDLEK